jgi:hypothetical protein
MLPPSPARAPRFAASAFQAQRTCCRHYPPILPRIVIGNHFSSALLKKEGSPVWSEEKRANQPVTGKFAANQGRRWSLPGYG